MSERKPMSLRGTLFFLFLLAMAGGWAISEIVHMERETREGCPFGQVHKIDHEGHKVCGFN